MLLHLCGHQKKAEKVAETEEGNDHQDTQETNTMSDPLHGVTLKAIVERLVEHYGWEELGHRIRINSFTLDPSVKSSLTFLRKTPWARQKVENLYLELSSENNRTPSEGRG